MTPARITELRDYIKGNGTPRDWVPMESKELLELLNQAELSDEAVSACDKIMEAIAGHTDWHPSPHVDEPNWNEDAHIEPTITVRDCRALKKVLEKAGKIELYY